MKIRFGFILFFFLIFSCGFTMYSIEFEEQITTESLFKEMTDMVNLTKFPSQPYTTIQYSSYDRRSKLPDGRFWFANSDGFGQDPIPNFQKVLKEPGEDGIGTYLMAECEGPGSIVRLWSAAITGEVALYLDHSDTPLYEGRAIDFFHKTYDCFSFKRHFDKQRFESTVYQQEASYAPIPFSKNMKLIWKGDINTLHFYQINVRKYNSGTKVVSFSAEQLETIAKTIDKVTSILDDPEKLFSDNQSDKQESIESMVKPGIYKEVFKQETSGAVGRLSIKLNAQNIEKALRQTILHIAFDNHSQEQIQCPVGDFFGAAPGINPFVSLPFSVYPDGTMVSMFVMPFNKSIRIGFENLGDQNIEAETHIRFIDYDWEKEHSMHFRARWRVNHNIVSSNKRIQDIPFLVGHGKGIYVGSTSILLNPSPVPTPYGSWWGEGDEKIFLNNESFPSTFGTGSEDYYNYSWSKPAHFSFPYCGQPRNDGPGNRGFVTNFRWHILDCLPFLTGIRFYMEMYSHETLPGLSYARTAYHYAFPGMTDDHMVISPDDVRALELPENWKPALRMGASNSIYFEAEKMLTAKNNLEFDYSRLWTEDQCLVWNPKSLDQSLAFEFDVNESGKKRIHFVMGKTPLSGKLSFALDGKLITVEDINLSSPYRTVSRNFTLKEIELGKGKHTLTVFNKGQSNDSMESKFYFDFLWIQNRNN